ncbi:TIGR00730 family Rossman fold protein [Alphaproteobacteria bacterium]|nr:TIGR00730 family Rossman fold protein [Alphaproteobacteria bacterium]
MNNIKTLTVYLGSSGYASDAYKQTAIDLGHTIAEKDYYLVYGGMDAGLMGLLAKAVLEKSGDVTGIVPQKLKDSERILPNLSETILVEDLWDRKKRMFKMADAILALPGGFGTLDESLEVLYWGSLKLHNKPLVLINIEGYWDKLIGYLYSMGSFDERYLIVVNNLDDIWPKLESWEPIAIPPDTPHHYPHFEAEITRITDQYVIIDKANIENTYYAICALGLKQLGKHDRPIGFINENGQFDNLLEWLERAAKETFITQKCLQLFDSAPTREELSKKLADQNHVDIDLHNEKWGDAV